MAAHRKSDHSNPKTVSADVLKRLGELPLYVFQDAIESLSKDASACYQFADKLPSRAPYWLECGDQAEASCRLLRRALAGR
jgi:hypothetical protein